MSSSSQVVTSQQVTQANEASGSSKPMPTDTNIVEGDTAKKGRNKRNRNRKKNPNVLNATEAGTPVVEGESNTERKSPPNKKPSNKPKQPTTTTNSVTRINKNRAQGRLTENQIGNQDDSGPKPSSPKKKSNNNNNRSKQVSKLPPGNHDMATVLAHELKNSTYECMICMDIVRPAHHVWTCDCCWAVFHLNCVQTWATKSLKGNKRKSIVVDKLLI